MIFSGCLAVGQTRKYKPPLTRYFSATGVEYSAKLLFESVKRLKMLGKNKNKKKHLLYPME